MNEPESSHSQGQSEMSPKPQRTLRELFLEAAEIEDASARAAFLDQACGSDVLLRRRLDGLLAADEEAGPAQATVAAQSQAEPVGSTIGRYKLLQKIGEGGCGVVYMAEQEEPVRRRVALKVIKLGMDTKSVIARFEAERQALALMDHPNIAKVLDGGATETPLAHPMGEGQGARAGRPYFVMELVRGVKITDYCDEKQFSTQERLGLFSQVCHAIQHAHQKGIIHRDIKPSNILVTVNDGVAVPKVIDFGIAKATTDQRLTDKTVFTAFEQFIGTPAYMSPEQAEISSVDVDTRSDIYSLGVLLYELLTGQTPFDAKELLKVGLDEMRRTIREKEPERPSTRVSTLGGEELTTTAKRRGLDAPKLASVLRGDLDWIVMKCLEKDRGRRYETANGLATDIQRHLKNEPVVACPPSRLYRLQKMVRRNKVAFATGGAIAAALLLGLCVVTLSLLRERTARIRAATAEKEQIRLREQAQVEEGKAHGEAASRQEISEFLQDMLRGIAPSIALGRDTTLLREILDRADERISKEFTNKPYVEAVLRQTVGEAYRTVGEYEKAESNLSGAVALGTKVAGRDSLTVALALSTLGDLLFDERRLDECEKTYRESLEIFEKGFGADHPVIAATLSRVASTLHYQGRNSEAEPYARQALEMDVRLRSSGESRSLNNLANILRDEGKAAEAEAMLRESLEMKQRLGWPENHPDIAATLSSLAITLRRQGKLEEAEMVWRRRLAIYRNLIGEHPDAHAPVSKDLSFTIQQLCHVLREEGKTAEAEDLFHELLPPSMEGLPQSAAVVSARANLLAESGRWPEALRDMRKALEFDPQDHWFHCGLAALLAETGDKEAYRHCCGRILAEFGRTKDPNVADRVAKACLILSASRVDLGAVRELVETGLGHGNRSAEAWHWLSKALVEYRLNRFATAAEWADSILNQPDRANNRDLAAYAILAMAQFRSTEDRDSRASLAKAKNESRNLGDDWIDWIFGQALLREAEGLIDGRASGVDERIETIQVHER